MPHRSRKALEFYHGADDGLTWDDKDKAVEPCALRFGETRTGACPLKPRVMYEKRTMHAEFFKRIRTDHSDVPTRKK